MTANPDLEVTLRAVEPDDLPIFFTNQLDPEANWMAGFAADDPHDRPLFDAHWVRMLASDDIVVRTVLAGGKVAGNITAFTMGGEREVGYWIGREFWGQGIATAALRAFLEIITERPLFARTAEDNIGSQRVLEKNDFVLDRTERAISNTRHQFMIETIFTRPA